MNPFGSLRTLVLGVTLGSALGIGVYLKGRADGRDRTTLAYELRLAQAASAAIKQQVTVEAQNTILQDRMAALTEEQTHAQQITDRLSRALAERVSTRDARPSAPADTGARAGNARVAGLGTGAQLYREDSEFLVREAARADRLRAAYRTCFTQYTALHAVLRASGYADTTTVSPALDSLP